MSGAPVVVVGAGIVGMSCAAYLRRDGREVIVVEREGPGTGTSRGNAGALSPYSCVPLAMPGVFTKIPGWLTDPEGPLTIQPRYFTRALPWLPKKELSWRLHFIMGALSYTLAATDAAKLIAELTPRQMNDDEALLKRLAPFLLVGIMSPVMDLPEAGREAAARKR